MRVKETIARLKRILKKQTFQNVLIFFFFFGTLSYFFSNGMFFKNNVLNAATAINSYLSTNTVLGSTSSTTALTSLESNGFTLGTSGDFNKSGNFYSSASWIESTTSGFDIVEYTGTGANTTISHSLGAVPSLVIVKRRDAAGVWAVYHQKNAVASTMVLNTNAALTASTTVWNSTTPTSAVFSLGTAHDVNKSGGSYTAYVFREIDGYSKFNSYEGNASADGPFLHTGFKPKWVMIKRTDSTGDWLTFDTSRDPFNVATSSIKANSTTGKYAFATALDILSNGFKIRTTANDLNASGGTYIYIAFADMPYKSQFPASGLTIASSTMFDGSTQYMNEPGATTDVSTYTVSVWVKRGDLGRAQAILNNRDSSNNGANWLYFNADDTLLWQGYLNNSASIAFWMNTKQVFRDTNKWYHIVANYDGTTAKLYVDGQEVSMLTTNTQNGGGANLYTAASALHIGVNNNTLGEKFNGYLAEINVIDGQALAPTSFGAFDSNCGWGPITYAGAYGTNGIRLTFGNPASPGADSSGNGNNLTPTGFDTTDGTIDSPTNNFNTANYIDPTNIPGYAYTPNPPTFSNGNTKVADGSGQASGFHAGSISIPASGNWYTEVYVITQSSSNVPAVYLIDTQEYTGGYRGIFGTINNGTPGTAATWGAGAILGLHINNGVADWYKNNVFQSTFSVSGNISIGGYFSDAGGSYVHNSGQLSNPTSTATTLTYRPGAGGYFVYDPPAGAKTISTANLSAPTITKPADYFDAFTYTGNGTGTTTNYLSFSPSLVWIKDMVSTNNHGIFYSATAVVTSVLKHYWMEI